jgi:hypothetical protein
MMIIVTDQNAIFWELNYLATSGNYNPSMTKKVPKIIYGTLGLAYCLDSTVADDRVEDT